MADRATGESDLLTLAFSINSNPGAYALLLGAGVSAPSGIPTAWGVLEDLVSRAASLTEDGVTDPIAWYQHNYQESPTYEGVLERIAPTQIERQRLLRGYFEQSSEDIDEGRKVPTAAHRAIARLVRSEALKVIVTLNFDHLIENAIRAEGVEPTVIATPADIDGMAPLHTLDCCVIHLHGDYLNPISMLNTVTELVSYHPSTDRLLRRILDDYGLIIAGWSAKYDPALRESIASHYPGRFTLTWFEPAEPSEEAKILRTLKKGIHVAQDADTGFGVLADGVTALAARRSRHPLTIPVAVETAKRELSGHSVAIGLHDTFRRELDSLHRLPEFHLTDYNADPEYEAMLERIEEATRLPAALLATLAYWGDDTTDRWWLEEMPRFASPAEGSGLTKLLSLRVVSGSILFYAVGVATVAAQRFDLLARLFAMKRPHRYNGNYEPLASELDAASGYEGAKNTHTRVFDLIAPLIADSLSLGDEPLEDAWQKFEILRLAWATQNHPRFAGLQDKFADEDFKFATKNSEFEEAERHSAPNVSEAQAARAEAWQNRDRLLGEISRLPLIGRPHVLTVDNRADGRHRSLMATRIQHDLEAEGESHPLMTCGFFTSVDDGLVAVEAVSAALGVIGYESSRNRVQDSVGFIPVRMWIDSGQTPQGSRSKDWQQD